MLLTQLASIINRVLPEPHAGLLTGMLFGSKASLDVDLIDSLIKTGTLHIVALSGTNITIVVGLVSAVLLRFVSRRLASLLTCIIIIGYVWLVGVSPSVIRAAIMGSLALVAIAFGKQIWSLWLWTLAVVIMLVLNPLWIRDVSFLLSVFATLGILLFGSRRKADHTPLFWSNTEGQNSSLGHESKRPLRQLGNLGRFFFEENLRITLAAQLFTIPIILVAFGRISLISPLTNVLIGWTIAPVTAVGFFIILAGLLWIPIAYPLGWIAWMGLEFLIKMVDLTSKIPFASIGR